MPGEHAGLGICTPGAVPENTREYSFDPMSSQWNRLCVNRDRGLFNFSSNFGRIGSLVFV